MSSIRAQAVSSSRMHGESRAAADESLVGFSIDGLVRLLPSPTSHSMGADATGPRSWKLMSEADRVFSRHPKRDVPSGETQHIVTAPRKNNLGTMASRVVEVVHVSRGTSKPIEDHPRRVPWNAHAETWPDGFRAKSPPPVPQDDAQSVAPEPAPPIVHVMPMWEPSAPQRTPPDEKPDALPSGTAAVERRKPGRPRLNPPKVAVRQFADPFAEDDDSANCMRCGYLVEPVREKRGLLTCATCG